METHKDLRVWQQSIEMVTSIYLMTQSFPKEEMFGLVSQLRRASVSVPSNIAEGYARGTDKEKLHFLRISSGSMSEVETQLMLSLNLGYIDQEKYNKLSETVTSVWKQLNSLISSIKKRLALQEQFLISSNDQTTKPLNH
jgi:four helix bundle protein